MALSELVADRSTVVEEAVAFTKCFYIAADAQCITAASDSTWHERRLRHLGKGSLGPSSQSAGSDASPSGFVAAVSGNAERTA